MTTTERTQYDAPLTLDTSDLDRHMGVPMEPGELEEPVAVNDVRRWVQAMLYPNPLHYDERGAAESRFGSIVAPQSFTVATDTSHGCSPAQVGRIPNSHLIFGGLRCLRSSSTLLNCGNAWRERSDALDSIVRRLYRSVQEHRRTLLRSDESGWPARGQWHVQRYAAAFADLDGAAAVDQLTA